MAVEIEITSKILPQSIEAEQILLGSILLHETAYPLIASILAPADLFRDAHRRIIECMGKLIARGELVEMVLLKDALSRNGDLDEVGGAAYLASLVDGLPRVANIEHYARLVKEKAQLRAVIQTATALQTAAYDAQAPASATIEAGVQSLLALAHTSHGDAVRASDAAMAYVVGLDRTADNGAIPTGYTDLDEMLAGGLRRKELVILAGRPGAGKSSLGLGMARGIARNGYPVGVISLEMTNEALGGRLVSWGARVDKHLLQGGFLGERDYGRISEALGELDGLPLYLQDSAATLTQVAAVCQRWKAQYSVQVIIIDYLQLLAKETRNQSRESAVAVISSGLKQLAKVQDLALVALSALNRSPEGRRDNRPRLADLRESGSIENDADIVLLLFRADQYEKAVERRGIAEIIVAKSREGPTGTVKLAFIESFGGCFENLAPLTG